VAVDEGISFLSVEATVDEGVSFSSVEAIVDEGVSFLFVETVVVIVAVVVTGSTGVKVYLLLIAYVWAYEPDIPLIVLRELSLKALAPIVLTQSGINMLCILVFENADVSIELVLSETLYVSNNDIIY